MRESGRDGDKTKVFYRRAALLGGGQIALFSVLGWRMYQLQIQDAEKYIVRADGNRISLRLLPPSRGRILDRNGLIMADNRENHRLSVLPEKTEGLEKTLNLLMPIIPLSDYEQSRILREAARQGRRRFIPITIKENLRMMDVEWIEHNISDLPGVLLDRGETRYYPLGDLGAHILGYVGAVPESEQSDDPLLKLPGFRVGINGVEKIYDTGMRGKGGGMRVEVNVRGRVIRELSSVPPRAGNDLILSLDMNVQKFAAQRLGEESASAVVMDIHSGELIVMASTPSFDPNAFTRRITSEEWKALNSDPRAPLSNKAIAGQYSPGSTFKMVVAIAALEAGVISPEQRIFCSGHTEVGNIRFHCWRRGGHGALDMVGAMKNSCDIYFYELARRLGPDRIAATAKKFGLGEPTGVDLPHELGGLVPTRAWRQKRFKGPWNPGESLNYGIGQGYLLTTPLQLAVMTARIANGGRAVVPYVARDLAIDSDGQAIPRQPPDFPSIGVSKRALQIARKGMNAVSNEPGGTAYNARITLPGFELSGKTGTAQVRRISMRERETGVRRNDQLPWKERDHALFVAYAPEHDPRYAIAVVVEHGGGGSSVAAPIARDIMMEVQKSAPKSRSPLAGNQGGEDR